MDYGHPVRFGVFITPGATQPEHPLAVAALADELGFDLVGVQDHPYQSRFLDTWTLLTAMAMRTRKIGLFTDVANLPLRPPAILAKAAASLDLLSGGRIELGLGAGGALRRSRRSAARC
ncbi:MAG: LLM class flavin-dependent oxidoreductase [Candidatus Dormibacteraceae bacterium]